MKKFNGKVLYVPKGKALEYAPYAVNWSVGCSGKCDYCYCKQILKGLWSDKPVLKKSLVSPIKAFQIYCNEVLKNLFILRQNAIFFNFTSDPMLKENIELTINALKYNDLLKIPSIILTKQTWWYDTVFKYMLPATTTIGVTLTGHDELEPGCASNEERIVMLRKFKNNNYNTFVSIEPIIDFESSKKMILSIYTFVDHIKIGLQSGKKYDTNELDKFIDFINLITKDSSLSIYWKDSIFKQSSYKRENMPKHCVNSDYKYWL